MSASHTKISNGGKLYKKLFLGLLIEKDVAKNMLL